MPTLGTTGKPSSSWHTFGAGTTNIEVELIALPRRIRILEVGAWVGGWNDTPRTRLAVWSPVDGALLGQSAQISVADQGSGGPAGGNVALYVEALETPVDTGTLDAVYVGFHRHRDDKHQVSLGGSSSGPHYHDTAPEIVWPEPPISPVPPTEVARRCGVYIADYEIVAAGRVRVGGSFVELEAARARVAGAWVDLEAVRIRDSGTWKDAE